MVNRILLAVLLVIGIEKYSGNNLAPSTLPIEGSGTHAIIVEETKDRSKLPPEQNLIFTSTEVREWLDRNCTASPNGTPGWRIMDKDDNASNETKWIQNALPKHYKPEPALMISNGRKGYNGPLPKDVQGTLDLLSKYGKK